MIFAFISSIGKKLMKVRKIRSEGINIDKFLKGLQDEDKKKSNIYGMGNNRQYQEIKNEDVSYVDFSNKEATNFYELYKILSQENYELGKSVSDFIENFKEENSDIQESAKLIPRQMESILKFIDSCVSAFFCYFNYGKSITEKMLPYVRPAVEYMIFKKLSDLLNEIYKYKFNSENQRNIKKYMTLEEIMNFLEINKKFRIIDPFVTPFKSTIDFINKIEYELTPKDKFETLMRANLELRNEILDITRGKVNKQILENILFFYDKFLIFFSMN